MRTRAKIISGRSSKRSLSRIWFLPAITLSLGSKQKPTSKPGAISAHVPVVTTAGEPLLCHILGARQTAEKPELVTIQALFHSSLMAPDRYCNLPSNVLSLETTNTLKKKKIDCAFSLSFILGNYYRHFWISAVASYPPMPIWRPESASPSHRRCCYSLEL
jgi:hypothetical protein